MEQPVDMVLTFIIEGESFRIDDCIINGFSMGILSGIYIIENAIQIIASQNNLWIRCPLNTPMIFPIQQQNH